MNELGYGPPIHEKSMWCLDKLAEIYFWRIAMDRDKIVDRNAILKEAQQLHLTTRGTRRRRAPKGHQQRVKEAILKDAARRRPNVLEKMLKGRKMSAEMRRMLDAVMVELDEEDRKELLVELLS
jgi:ribosomal protein S19E (S16A)